MDFFVLLKTTVQLSTKNPFIMGDTGDDVTAARMGFFTDKLQKVSTIQFKFNSILLF